MGYTLHLGDCLEVMPTLASGSFDAIICDPPYGTTACKWDAVIPFAPMWRELKRLIKPKGAIVLFGSQPFTSALVMSNPRWFKWEDIWDKKLPTGFLDANRKPLRRHENILVFCDGQPTYNPQKTQGTPYKKGIKALTPVYSSFQQWAGDNPSGERFPTSIIEISNAKRNGRVHPTEKNLELMEYLVKTYTNEGETVLDFTMGSGTTGIACLNTERHFVGIERDPHYFAIAQQRLEQAAMQRAERLPFDEVEA